ncbi:uncharacterized protein [Engystomops pustulosus]|uniref:uncharacterized protein n=1 Tax=Engystomops pustulosus TaxID=76066 RepID=UPI003AFA4571
MLPPLSDITILFTDNGVIVFQRNTYDPVYVLSYPYTTFQSNDPLTPPLIAAFWADADLSGGIGDIYYQVYDFQLSNADTIFKKSIESSFNGYFRFNFNILWAIKITWDNIPPFTSTKYNLEAYWKTQVNNTNTYQVVLATDGIYSFALILFEDGGMKWKYNSLTGFHLPKMGYYSGIPSTNNFNNFPAFNDPQTEPSVSIAQRYTPDQYKGYNTGKKGQWAYRLDSNSQSTLNSRLQCLSWYYSEVTPTWLFGTSSCPCTYNQAKLDPSFTDGLSPLYYGFDLKGPSEQYWSVQNMFPSRDGSGSRCYYSWSGALVYGEKERYLPTPWISFNFLKFYLNQKDYGDYFWKTVLPPQRKLYKVGEIDPFNMCCKYSGSNYLCNLYREKRPLDFCQNYVPPRLGFFYGDPHINTLDGVPYTFNGLGEFILADVKDEKSTTVFTLQGRTALSMNGSSNATNFVGLAAVTSTGDQVQWSLQNDNETVISYNGTNIPLSDNLTYVEHVAFGKTSTGEANVYFDMGISISSSVNFGILSFVLTLEPKFQNRTTGLLGVYNGNPNDDFLSADGYTLTYNESTKLKDSQIFSFGMTWKTTPENSIFHYNSTNGESWYAYNNNSFIPLFYDELITSSNPDIIQKANITCKGNENCLFDILSTGNFDVGSATKASDQMYTDWRTNLDIFPPNISGPQTVMSSLNVQVLINYTAAGSMFNIDTTSSDVILTENGSLSWLPSSSVPVYATVRANNTQATAELGLTLILCNCSNNATCDYENTVLRGERNNSKFMTATCKCSSGWTGEFCTEDYDACLENSCFNTSSCVDNKAPLDGYQCSQCPPGLYGDGIKCFDIDECYEGKSDCDQICINTLAGYSCACNNGYEISADNKHCNDINECMNSSSCAENALCSNAPGNYSCHCADGYDGDPYIFCTDINECATPLANNCTSTSICINTNGSYHCECLPGYTGPNCIDIQHKTTTESITEATLSSSVSISLEVTSSIKSTTVSITSVAENALKTSTESSISSQTGEDLLKLTSNTGGIKLNLTESTTLRDTQESPASSTRKPNIDESTITSVHSAQTILYPLSTTSDNPASGITISGSSTVTSTNAEESTTELNITNIVIGSSTTNLASTITSNPDTLHLNSSTSSTLHPNTTSNVYLALTSVSNTTVTSSNTSSLASTTTVTPDTLYLNSSTTSTLHHNTASNVYLTLPSVSNTTGTESNTTSSASTITGNPATLHLNSSTTTLHPNVTSHVYSTLTSVSNNTVTGNPDTSHFIRSTTTILPFNITSNVFSTLTSVVNTTVTESEAKSSASTIYNNPATLHMNSSTTSLQPIVTSNVDSTLAAVLNTTVTGESNLSTASSVTSKAATSHINSSTTTLQSNVTSNVNSTLSSVSSTIVTRSFSTTSASTFTGNTDISHLQSSTTTLQSNVTSNGYSALTSVPNTTVTGSRSSSSASTITGTPDTLHLNSSTTTALQPNVPSNVTQTTVSNTTSYLSQSSISTTVVPSHIASTSTITNSTTVTSTNSSHLTIPSSASSLPSTGIWSPNNVTSFGASSSSTGQLQTNTTTATSCNVKSCPAVYCSNGGICSVSQSSCSLQCKCPNPFAGDKCTSILTSFIPQPYKEIIKRRVEIRAWIKGETGLGLNDPSSAKYSRLEQAVNSTSSSYLQDIVAFDKISKVLLSNVNGKALSQITSDFTYSNNATIIKLLNENLVQTIMTLFNSKSSNRRRRDIAPVSFGLLTMDNFTDVAIASMSQLEDYFNCNNTGFLGYILNFSDSGFTCVSPCLLGYCHNNAVCEHKQNGPICRCASFSMYTAYGDTCENLAINLNAFFGILFGSLAFVVLVTAIIILIIYCYRKKTRTRERDVIFKWGSKPITTFRKLSETDVGGQPQLKRFTPCINNVSFAPKFKIQRPSLERKLQPSTDQ